MAERFVADLDAAHGELVELASGHGLVTAVLERGVEIAPLERDVTRAVSRRGVPTVPVPSAHRTIDPLGEPLDGGPALTDSRVPIFGRDPVVLPQHYRRLTFGALVHDLPRRMPMGTSHLTVGPRDQLYHLLQHQYAVGRTVIIAMPARVPSMFETYQRNGHPRVLEFTRVFDVPHIRVTVGERASETAAWLVPWAALAIGDALRKQGRDVVVVIENLENWRFGVRRMPERGSWSTQLATLTSRAYATETGSVSVIAHAREPSPTLVAAFDQILELDRHGRGDFGRVVNKWANPPVKMHNPRALGSALLTVARYHEIRREFPWADKAPLDRNTSMQLEHGARITECLRYRPGCTVDLLEQQLALLAVVAIPDVPAHAVADFVTSYIEAVRGTEWPSKIRAANKLDEATDKALIELAKQVATNFMAS